MKYFFPKFAIVLFIATICSSVAVAGGQSGCHYAFGHGVAEQNLLSAETPNPYRGPIQLRIGSLRLSGNVDMVITDGFGVPTFNPEAGVIRVTGVGKNTFDFGQLGAFHTWEVDTSTLVGPPPHKTSTLVGDIRTGPHRDVLPGGPPVPWGTGYFAHTDASLKGWGSNRFEVTNKDGYLVNEFTYMVWGRICDVDLQGIRDALSN